MSDQFGSLLPIWDWHPALVAAFVFVIDFGAIMAIRVVIERKFYLTRWWSFRVGDTIGLPVYAGFGAIVVSDGEFTGFYTAAWWHILVLTAGYVIAIGIQVNNLRTGFFTWSDVVNPSEVYHTVIFGVMFYLMVTVVFALAADRSPVWAVVLASTGLTIYVLSWIIDQTTLIDKTPGRYNNSGGKPERE